MIHSVRKLLQRPLATPVILLLLCLIAYGVYLPWMGFYWDDWPWIWRYHVYGAQAIREIDAAFRPLAGIVLWIGAKLAGENALGWQVYNLVIRWLGGVAFWWSLRQIWPKRREAAIWAGVLFILYPGFGQQFVSVNSSRHLFPLVTFLLSLGFTARAYRDKRLDWTATGMAVALSIFTMLTTEYYYGLELVRGYLLVLLIKANRREKRATWKDIIKAWVPYLLPLVGVYAWRFAVSQQVNYQINLVDQFATAPVQTVVKILWGSLGDFLEVSLGALGRLFGFPDPGVFGPRKTIFYGGIVFLSAVGTWRIATLVAADSKDRRWNHQALALGGLAVWISGLPFWSTDLAVKLTFPNDRLTLPMMAGFSIVMVALLDLLTPRILKNLVLGLVVGLSIGLHFQNAISYQRDWEIQTAFFQQLAWRAPGLMNDTALLSPELPIQYATDNSLTAPLNWIYSANQPSNSLPYGLFFLDLRLGTKIPSLEADASIKMDFGQGVFTGSTTQAIVLQYAPPACLRVLDPVYDQHLPGTPEIMDAAMKLSDVSRIQADVEPSARLPNQIFSTQTSPSEQWCYYFQRANLARQTKDWERVASLGDIAFDLDDSPNLASERVPFIEGYAHVGDWEAAVEGTFTTMEIDKFMGPMLCDTWERIRRDMAASEALSEAVSQVERQLDCGFDV